jgi:hypothetical protein
LEHNEHTQNFGVVDIAEYHAKPPKGKTASISNSDNAVELVFCRRTSCVGFFVHDLNANAAPRQLATSGKAQPEFFQPRSRPRFNPLNVARCLHAATPLTDDRQWLLAERDDFKAWILDWICHEAERRSGSRGRLWDTTARRCIARMRNGR